MTSVLREKVRESCPTERNLLQRRDSVGVTLDEPEVGPLLHLVGRVDLDGAAHERVVLQLVDHHLSEE